MLKSLKLPSALVISLFCLAPLVQADEQLLDGVHPFICDGEAAVLLQTDNGWASIGEPNIEVSELRNGWRFGDQGMGFIGYLKEYEQDEWTFEFLSDGGYERVSCIDLTESVSEVVTAIKPRLGELFDSRLLKTLEACEMSQAAANDQELRGRLAVALAGQAAAEARALEEASLADQRAALLAAANDALSQEEATSAEAQRQTALLNQQVAALRTQLSQLQGLLDETRKRDEEAQIQLQTLESELNIALARAASEERRRRQLEAALE